VHLPLSQLCEQQSPSTLQVLPEVLQLVLKGAQVPEVHCPPQHWALAVHF
jgi:hypothetical protein